MSTKLGIYDYSDWTLIEDIFWARCFFIPYPNGTSCRYVGAIWLSFNSILQSWELSFSNYIELKSIHLSIYKSTLYFGTVDLGKQHVDEFLSKLKKLKAFL